MTARCFVVILCFRLLCFRFSLPCRVFAVRCHPEPIRTKRGPVRDLLLLSLFALAVRCHADRAKRRGISLRLCPLASCVQATCSMSVPRLSECSSRGVLGFAYPGRSADRRKAEQPAGHRLYKRCNPSHLVFRCFGPSVLLLLVVILSTRRSQMREGPASSLLSALAFCCHPERAKRRGISLCLCLWAHQNPQQRKSPQVVASQPRYKPARGASSRCAFPASLPFLL